MMGKKSKQLFVMAGIAMLMSLVLRFAFAVPATDLSDFTIDLGVALMVGVLLIWRDGQAPAA